MPVRLQPSVNRHARRSGWRDLLADRRTRNQFARFLGVGILNTAFGYAVFSAAVLARAPPDASLVLAYLLGVPFNFLTNRIFVFSGLGRASLWRFVLAYAVIYVVNLVAYRLLVAAGIGPLLSQAICLPALAVFAFALFKLHVFRVRTEAPPRWRASERQRWDEGDA